MTDPYNQRNNPLNALKLQNNSSRNNCIISRTSSTAPYLPYRTSASTTEETERTNIANIEYLNARIPSKKVILRNTFSKSNLKSRIRKLEQSHSNASIFNRKRDSIGLSEYI
jgi:hypothetical protein